MSTWKRMTQVVCSTMIIWKMEKIFGCALPSSSRMIQAKHPLTIFMFGIAAGRSIGTTVFHGINVAVHALLQVCDRKALGAAGGLLGTDQHIFGHTYFAVGSFHSGRNAGAGQWLCCGEINGIGCGCHVPRIVGIVLELHSSCSPTMISLLAVASGQCLSRFGVL